MLLLDEPSAGLSPVMQDEVFVQTRRINKAGVSVVMVEQNAARCLQICDRAYVLDQGRNAYTGTGEQLANDPKVIELYLGTLARSSTDHPRSHRRVRARAGNATEPRPTAGAPSSGASDEPGHGRTPETESTWA